MATLKLTCLCLSFCLWRVAHCYVAFGGAGVDALEGAYPGAREAGRMYNRNLAAVENADLAEGDAAEILQYTLPGGAPGANSSKPGGAPGANSSKPGGGGSRGGFDYMSIINQFVPNGGRRGGGAGGQGGADIAQMLQGIFGSFGRGRGGSKGAVDAPPLGGAGGAGETGGAGKSGGPGAGRRGPPPEIAKFIAQFMGAGGRGNNGDGGFPNGFP